MGRYRKYTEAELETIRTRYAQEGPRRLAKEMGRCVGSVRNKAKGMGITCSEGVRARLIAEGRQRYFDSLPGDRVRRERTAATLRRAKVGAKTRTAERRERTAAALRRAKVGAKTRTAERREEAVPAPRRRLRDGIKRHAGHCYLDPERLAALPPTGCMPNALEFMAWQFEEGER